MLIEQRVTNDAKSTGVAYLLWFFLGGFGGHRFYLGRTGTAIAQLIITLIGVVTSVVGVGLVFLAVTGIWVLVDAFLIPGMVSNQKEAVRQKFTQQAMIYGRAEPRA